MLIVELLNSSTMILTNIKQIFGNYFEIHISTNLIGFILCSTNVFSIDINSL